MGGIKTFQKSESTGCRVLSTSVQLTGTKEIFASASPTSKKNVDSTKEQMEWEVPVEDNRLFVDGTS